jgi:hypothetical protein
MKFVIGNDRIKTFSKSILTLSKIGDEIYLEPTQQSLSIRTVNASRSAFARFSFNQAFFTHYDPAFNLPKGAVNPNETLTTSQDDEFKCKIPAKCLLTIFRNINFIEKNVEKCTITIKRVPLSQDSAAHKIYDFDTTMMTKIDDQLFDIKFLIIMNCKHGLRKTFILSISDCENLQAAFTAEHCTSHLNIPAKNLHDTINSFSNDTEEISFLVEAKRLNIKNYVEPENVDVKIVNTQVSFDSAEFEFYEIDKCMDITFCLKEFKILLLFGAWLELMLQIYFKTKGRPIIFNYEGNGFEASFTLATLVDGLSVTPSQSSGSVLSVNSAVRHFDDDNSVLNQTENQRSFLLEKRKSTGSSGQKRALFDSSNNNEYLLNRKQQMPGTNSKSNDSDEDDALLTQVLQEHQNKVEAERTLKSTRPTKKIKSLVQTLFENNDDEDPGEEEQEEEDLSEKMDSDQNAGSAVISLENFLDDSLPGSNNEIKKAAPATIYIEETDSEED